MAGDCTVQNGSAKLIYQVRLLPRPPIMDYKQKYIALQKAVSDLKRGNPSEKTMQILYGWDSIDFSTGNAYMVDAAFDRKDRENFIKRLNKDKVDLYRLFWLKSELDAVRTVLDGMDEKNPKYSWFSAAEKILDGLLNNSFISLV